MKNPSVIKWLIPIFIALILCVYFFLSPYYQSAKYEVEQGETKLSPQATMKLKDVMYLKWDNDVSDISNEIPGGKLIQHRFNGRQMNLYMINALLADIDSYAKVSFQRNENNSGQIVTHRWIKLNVSSTEEIETKYEQIIKTLPSYGMKIMNLGGSDNTESTFHIKDPDGSGGIQLDFRKDLKNMEIKIDVTRYEIITKQ